MFLKSVNHFREYSFSDAITLPRYSKESMGYMSSFSYICSKVLIAPY